MWRVGGCIGRLTCSRLREWISERGLLVNVCKGGMNAMMNKCRAATVRGKQ